MDGLLAGVRVLDFSVWRPGPYATQLLGELGADIIKIEPPGGDPMRAYPSLFATLNVNKRSVVLDLKSDGGRARARDLATQTDVVVEGFRPGVAARLGIAYDDIAGVNPSIVYCSVSGFGQSGPLADAPGHDAIYQAWGGALAPDGGEARVSALPIADLAGGMAAAFAICAAVVRQMRTGEGEYIDAAMADVVATWTGAEVPVAQGTDASARGVPGYGTFATADGGSIALGVLTEDHFWRALCDTLGLHDYGALDFRVRMERQEQLNLEIAQAVGGRLRDDLVTSLLAADVPAAPVLTRGEMVDLEHFRVRGAIVEGFAPDTIASGHPVRFTRHPAARHRAAPEIDEHADAAFNPRGTD